MRVRDVGIGARTNVQQVEALREALVALESFGSWALLVDAGGWYGCHSAAITNHSTSFAATKKLGAEIDFASKKAAGPSAFRATPDPLIVDFNRVHAALQSRRRESRSIFDLAEVPLEASTNS